MNRPRPIGPLYGRALDFIVRPLIDDMEKCGDGLIVVADTSISEERQKDKRHFAFSTGEVTVDLRDLRMVPRGGIEPPTP